MNNVDISGWEKKSEAVKTAFRTSAAVEILKAAQEIFDASIVNLSGPTVSPITSRTGRQYFPPPKGGASMPVRVLTGFLRRSMHRKPISEMQWLIWQDETIANYGKWVHDGTSKMIARRYLGDPVRIKGPQLKEKLAKNLKEAIRKEGQK